MRLLYLLIFSTYVFATCPVSYDVSMDDEFLISNLNTEAQIENILFKKGYSLGSGDYLKVEIEIDEEMQKYRVQSTIQYYRDNKLKYYTQGFSRFYRKKEKALKSKNVVISLSKAFFHLPGCQK